MAIVANVILLLNMARKIRWTIAQPITIVTWYISSFCLIALTGTAAGPLIQQPAEDYIWSGAFYYGLYAAVLYFFCSSLMIVTVYGAAKGYYSKDFQLTTSQRTLMLQTIMFLIYLLVGALVFSKIEGWAYLDGVYWADATLFTVGFGDFYCETPLGRALMMPYALIGIISLGLVVGSIRSLVLERGRRQLSARMLEKNRKRVLKRMIRRGKDDILTPITDNENEDSYSDARSQTTSGGLTELERRQKEFGLMRKIQARSERSRRWMAMGTSTMVWLILWTVGAAIFQQCELKYQDWNYFTGFYFAFVSLTTIGYGDVTPISPAGKSFFVFWSLLALPTMTVLISNAGDTIVKLIREWTDWLGTVTVLPNDAGIGRELKMVAKALSMGTVFGDDSDVEEQPPGFLGDSNNHRYRDEDDDDDDESREEKLIAEEGGRQRLKSTKNLQREVYDIADERGMDPPKTDPSPVTKENGESPSSSLGQDDQVTEASTLTPSSARPASSATKQNALSFQEPAELPSASSRKSRNPLKLDTRKSSFRSKKSGTPKESQPPKLSRAFSMPRTSIDLPNNVPADRNDLTVLLIDEISHVTQHLKSHPPRKYSFEEWAWFLKLIGEDESNAVSHKKPVPKKNNKKTHHKHGGGDGSPSDIHDDGGDQAEQDDPDRLQWSWVGSRSPLMGSQEEAEWVLEKLEQKLAEELRAMRNEALEARRVRSDPRTNNSEGRIGGEES